VLGGGPVFTRYGFRRVPYASRITFRSAYSTGTSAVNADFEGDFRFSVPGLAFLVRAQALRGDAIQYFGIGNETVSTDLAPFYILHQQAYRFEPRFVFGMGSRTEVSIGGTARLTVSDEDRPTLALLERPYGFGSFSAIGAVAGFKLDVRDDPVYPVLGVRAQINGSYFPAVGDVAQPFGVVEGEVAGFLGTKALPATPVLALRGGGARGFGRGDIPFFEAPAIGGRRSVRGYSNRRFTGDDALYGSAELRLNFGGFKVILPGEWGIYGLGDIGRVQVEGESSSVWHKSWGAGLWIGFFDRRSAISVTYAKGESGRVYLAGGYHF